MAVTCVDADLARGRHEFARRCSTTRLRQAAAIDLLNSTARSVELMRRMGAVVVESPPELGAACVDGYLRLKRRARL